MLCALFSLVPSPIVLRRYISSCVFVYYETAGSFGHIIRLLSRRSVSWRVCNHVTVVHIVSEDEKKHSSPFLRCVPTSSLLFILFLYIPCFRLSNLVPWPFCKMFELTHKSTLPKNTSFFSCVWGGVPSISNMVRDQYSSRTQHDDTDSHLPACSDLVPVTLIRGNQKRHPCC